MMIFSLVAMTGLEKCCITSAYLQWLCHSGERPVARGPLVSTSFLVKYLHVGEDGPGQGHLCHTDTFLVYFQYGCAKPSPLVFISKRAATSRPKIK